MRLLLISPFPYGKTSGQGGATICFNALSELAKDHQVTVLCFSSGSDSDCAAEQEMRSVASRVLTVPLRVGKLLVLRAKLLSSLGFGPEQAYYFGSPRFSSALERQLQQLQPDLVICQFPQMAQFLPKMHGFPVIQDVQDAFSVSWYRRYRAARGWASRWYARRQWLNWIDYESRYYPQASQCWTLSDQDRFGLTAFIPGLKTVTVGLPLVQDVEKSAARAERPVVGFLASFGHMPNVEGLSFLLECIAPGLSREIPGLEFLIAGRNPPEALVRAAPANVRFIGFVDSLADFYAQCTVVVAPLLSGGGVKIKVAEALSYGKAVVTTSVGAEGMELEDGVHAAISDVPGEMIQRLAALLRSPEARKKLESGALLLAQSEFSRSAWRQKCGDLLKGLGPDASGAHV
ncbi:glycosyltransferase [Niveibacterium terrae]|uniref:glycosyltransferase n=1 Tax=Niveibacterium terrae TaxID=3373598 RepID=UPI003A958126